MNTRKNIDHTELFTALSSAVESELLHRIESAAHSEMALDTADEVCYTGENTETEGLEHDEDPLCVSGEHFLIESAGTYPAGGPVNPPAAEKLAEHGISCAGKFSRQLVKADYDRFDLLIGMDNLNLVTMQYMFDNDPEGKLHRLLDYTGDPRNIEDPWYTRDFETAWQDIEKGCRGLLETLQNKGNDGC